MATSGERWDRKCATVRRVCASLTTTHPVASAGGGGATEAAAEAAEDALTREGPCTSPCASADAPLPPATVRTSDMVCSPTPRRPYRPDAISLATDQTPQPSACDPPLAPAPPVLPPPAPPPPSRELPVAAETPVSSSWPTPSPPVL